MSRRLVLNLFAAVLIAAATGLGAVPQLITYQGLLSDSTGSPLANGLYAIQFQIYDAPVGGTVKWNGGARQVNVSDGLFTYNLGDSVALPTNLFANDSSLWLGVKVGTNPEFSPRTRLTSYGYAYEALRADTADFAMNFLGGPHLPLAGGTMTGPITSTGNPSITMGKGNFGSGNTNAGANAFVAGENNIASGFLSTVGGGSFNTATGPNSTVPGGGGNEASGAFSFAAGLGAKAIHDRSFVWGTSSLIDFTTTAELQFLILASGGVGIGTNSPMEQLDITNPNTSGNSAVRTNRASTFVANGLTLATAGVNKWSLRQPPTATDNLIIFNHNLGSAAMNFDLTNNNVGIGTNSPLFNLHIFENVDSDVGLRIENPNTGFTAQERIDFGNGLARIMLSGFDNAMALANNRTSGTMEFEVGGARRLFITNSGNVGIGTTSPTKKLEVAGSIKVGTNDTVFSSNISSNSPLALQAPAGTTRMFVNDATGSVGIGTTTPEQRLHVSGGPILLDNNQSVAWKTSGGANQGILFLNSIDDLLMFSGGTATSDIHFRTGTGNFDTKMSITGAGDVGIGTSTPNGKLHIDDADWTAGPVRITGLPGSSIGPTLELDATVGTAGNRYSLFSTNTGAFAGGGKFAIFHRGPTNQGYRMVIDSTGNVGIGTVAPTTPLQVAGSISASGSALAPAFTFVGDLNTGMHSSGADALGLSTGGVQRVRVNSSGDVGIGTTNPFRKLEVVSDGPLAGFDKTSTDGIMLLFLRDGTIVGSISVLSGIVSYNAFTGSHYGWTDESIRTGELVTFTGDNQRLHNNPESEIIYGIRKSSLPNDPACLGSYLALSEPDQPFSLENPHLIMAVGNGDMWVTDESGDIKPGDYLISSTTPGHAMKDDEVKYPIGHIVARAAESVDWTTVTESIDGHKHNKISVLYGNFVRSDVSVLNKTIEKQQIQIDELKASVKELKTSMLRSQLDN